MAGKMEGMLVGLMAVHSVEMRALLLVGWMAGILAERKDEKLDEMLVDYSVGSMVGCLDVNLVEKLDVK